jgi:hypothetical protein
MKRKNSIFSKKYLIPLLIFTSIILTSCDIDELNGVEDVKVRTETRIVLPLAYGTIEFQTLINYISPNDSTFPIDDLGFLSFPPDITEFQYPENFAFQGSMLNVISHLELRIETENRLPLGISIELTFADSITNKEYGDPINCNLLKPAIIDQDGKVTQSTHNVETVILDNKSILEYQKSNMILAIFKFFLPETNNETISVNQKDFLSLNVGVVVQAKTNEN